MYVKLFQQILSSTLAADRELRHLFTDLLLLADSNGVVLKTEEAIAREINATEEQVRLGIEALQKPDPRSKNREHDGRRVIPLEGHAYGWQIVSYEKYRHVKDAEQLREANRLRVQRHRAKEKEEKERVRAGQPESASVSHDRPGVMVGNACNAHGNPITEAEAEAEKTQTHAQTSSSHGSSSSSDAPPSEACLARSSTVPVSSGPVADDGEAGKPSKPVVVKQPEVHPELKPYPRWWDVGAVSDLQKAAQARFVREWDRMMAAFDQAYPRLMLLDEVARAYAWEEANAGRRKTPRGRARFLQSWMERAANSR